MRRDTLAAGAAKASYGPISVSQDHWDSIFGTEKKTTDPKLEPSGRSGDSSRRTKRVKRTQTT